MTQKTINCAECEVEFTYEENPRFPRKYCLNCSAKKKASFEANQTEPPVVHEKPGETATGTVTIGEKPKDNGFHLTPEQVRSNALASAIEIEKTTGEKLREKPFWDFVKKVEKYILTGE